MERVQRWREPAVVVVVVALLLRLALVGAFAASAARLGANGAEAAALAGRQLGNPTPYVVLAVLVLTCHLPPVTAHAKTLAAVALGVSGAGLLLVLGLVLWGHSVNESPLRWLDLGDRLAGAVVSLLSVLLVALLATRPRGAVAEQTALPEQSAEPQPEPPVPPPDPALEPTWAPDAASGAAWTTAGEAASGRPASGWGTPAGTGWESPSLHAPAGSDQPGAGPGDEAPGSDDAGRWAQPRP